MQPRALATLLERIKQVAHLDESAYPLLSQRDLHQIDEDMAKRLNDLPATCRGADRAPPLYNCSCCKSAIAQIPTPVGSVDNGMPTEELIALVLMAKGRLLRFNSKLKSTPASISPSTDPSLPIAFVEQHDSCFSCVIAWSKCNNP